MARPVGRPPSCTCGECTKCVKRAVQRDWWHGLSDAQKRVYLDRRRDSEEKVERIRKRDRERGPTRPPRASDPQKERARHAAAYAIERGVLVRQPCEVCGATKVDAHHSDYTRPYDVRWLCRRHHMQLHRVYKPNTARSNTTQPTIGMFTVMIGGHTIDNELIKRLATGG